MIEIEYGCIPVNLKEFLDTKEMLRLKDIGMNCGVEYTSFSRFRKLDKYTRYEHSLGCLKIVYNFTHDEKQALAAFFHDIATPCFAHSIDFMNGDYLKQESTEEKTAETIINSKKIMELLKRNDIDVKEVVDYHLYPIADNKSPNLSADRLEYTLSNSLNFGFAKLEEILEIYNDITILKNEDSQEELGFRSLEMAMKFSRLSLECSKVYVSDEDRYSMQMIAEIIKEAISANVLTLSDLYTNEKNVIGLLNSNEVFKKKWENYCKLNRIRRMNSTSSRIINAKKRYINPLIQGLNRLTDVDKDYQKQLEEFINWDMNYPITGDYDGSKD